MQDIVFKLRMMHQFWRFRLHKEKHELTLVSQFELSGATVFDVGANKGIYSYWLSRAVDQNGKVFAFEPQPELQPHLARVQTAFNLTNIHVIDKAVPTIKVWFGCFAISVVPDMQVLNISRIA